MIAEDREEDAAAKAHAQAVCDRALANEVMFNDEDNRVIALMLRALSIVALLVIGLGLWWWLS